MTPGSVMQPSQPTALQRLRSVAGGTRTTVEHVQAIAREEPGGRAERGRFAANGCHLSKHQRVYQQSPSREVASTNLLEAHADMSDLL